MEKDLRTPQQRFDDLLERSSLGGPARARRNAQHEKEKQDRLTGMAEEQADWDDDGDD